MNFKSSLSHLVSQIGYGDMSCFERAMRVAIITASDEKDAKKTVDAVRAKVKELAEEYVVVIFRMSEFFLS
jgi:hypothetical protein